MFLVGAIASDYLWAPDLIPELPHLRRVRWTHAVGETELKRRTVNSLGSISALFSVSADVVLELDQHGTRLGNDDAALLSALQVRRKPSS